MNNQENSLHVVKVGYSSSDAVLDGFVVTGGHANRPNRQDEYDHSDISGAGLYSLAEGLIVSSKTIRPHRTAEACG
jgi:hypothetical protein